jgi:outer membrane protein OmpA-like peptidoglycan-associated protein
MVLLFSLVLAVPLAHGASVAVTGVEFLPGKTVTVPMVAQAIAPQAKVTAHVQFKHGQSRVRLKYDAMKPAILFGEDVTAYVLWALTADGRAMNLGEVEARRYSGTDTFYAGLKGFALVMTAEPYYTVARPSEMVVFVGGPPLDDKSRSRSYTYSELARAPRHANKSIADLEWDAKINLSLLQAKKALELAQRHGAPIYAKDDFNLAVKELQAAEAIAAENPASKKIDNPARNCVQLANMGINVAVRQKAAKASRGMMKAHQAELQAADERTEEAEYLAAALVNQTMTLRSENIELQALLEDALSKIATARVEAARIVLTLPGILFDTDKASLKPEAQMAMAKLSGILMVFHRAKVVIGGYTDSTGSAEHNVELSGQRAEAVRALLVDQGVEGGRLTAQGFGDADPIADNSTEKGRATNRRVEMIIIARAD